MATKKMTLTTLAFAAGVSALSARGYGCCFYLTASGGPGGPVGEIGDGQIRIGQAGVSQTEYCLGPDGGLIDDHGRGCIITESAQFQCDAGKAPFGGFSVGCDGTLSYLQDSVFYACPTGDNGGYNLYTVPVPHQAFCVQVTLSSDEYPCKVQCVPPPPPPQPVSEQVCETDFEDCTPPQPTDSCDVEADYEYDSNCTPPSSTTTPEPEHYDYDSCPIYEEEEDADCSSPPPPPSWTSASTPTSWASSWTSSWETSTPASTACYTTDDECTVSSSTPTWSASYSK
ncbi:hypothetical protein NA57DRAFT_71425 [Rhizodiscina lignyota]|uniref:Cell wall mannoprotein PIR1-like C-terminal domain-containing protein n=1 Tax=Rhizodiscina lignyota TaxID=1504668 RepID=A0A9P4IND5_9PEZI|nr:hypothetical protein NA57DRAFT_71425 [Rhizodiscina lignyota]